MSQSSSFLARGEHSGHHWPKPAKSSASSERTKRDVGNTDESLSDTVPNIPAGALLAGRYLVLRKLGRGGFSDVYLAHDHELDRSVAIKRLLLSEVDPHFIKDEAKTLASLDHPSIVRIYDICDESEYGYLVIMQYVPGPMLRDVLAKSLSIKRAVEIAIRICGGLIHSHSRGVVHRDIKPTNILMSSEGEPLIADFGLAFAPSSHCNPEGGTPRYMSPEQIRNETKRIGPSSDIFVTGILLYEMLTGKVPFDGETAEAISLATLEKPPPPIKELNPDVPLELDRIVQRALRKNVKDRYRSMEAFQADLIQWLTQADLKDELHASRSSDGDQNHSLDLHFASSASFATSSSNSLSSFTHRGLQPFESEDAKFFLSLVPGNKAPSGLPESVQYWKDWMEGYDDSEYGRIGILYGPSGSGKTSLIRAGIIPFLAPDLLPIMIECRKGEKVSQITSQILGQMENFQNAQEVTELNLASASESLTALLIRLRDDSRLRSEHRKVVLVFDQFDNWAGSATSKLKKQLASALRHCDGLSLQAILVVRDDFWTPATEFMRLVEIGVEQWRNARTIELLDKPHARWLLEAAGRSFGSLPPNPEPLDSDQVKFISQATDEMSVKGRVLPIQFAMFAKIAKLQRWHPDTLECSGGVQGAYVGYFQDLFESETSLPAYQRVCGAVVEVLHSLIPNADQTAHSHQVEFEELEAALAEKKLQNQLHRVLSILSEDLRIVVRISQPIAPPSVSDVHCKDRFHLAHDFLTVPISEWVEQVRKSSWRGKANARLEELAAMWGRKKHSRYLPTLLEFITIHAAIPARKQSPLQKDFLRSAGKMYLVRAILTLAFFAPVALFANWSLQQHRRNVAEHRKQVVQRVEAAMQGDSARFLGLLADTRNDQAMMLSALQPWLDSADVKFRTRTRLLATKIQPTSFSPLKAEIGKIEPQLSRQVIAIAKQCVDSKRLLYEIYEETQQVNTAKVRAAISLACMGDARPLTETLDDSFGTCVNNQVFNDALEWDSEPAVWIDVLRSNPPPCLAYYALCLLGSYPDDELPSAMPWEEISKLQKTNDGGVASTATWLLEKNERARKFVVKESSAQRRVLPCGLQQVLIAAGKTHHSIRVGRELWEDDSIAVAAPFWISCTAVTNCEFDVFLKDIYGNSYQTEMPTELSEHREEGDDNRAATGMNFQLALEYCNWLSKRAGLEPVYQEIFTDAVSFREAENANGFRLPTYIQAAFCASFGLHQTASSRISVKAFRKSEGLTLDTRIDNFFEIKRQANGLMPNRAGVQFDHDAHQCWSAADGYAYLLNSNSPSGGFAAFRVNNNKPRRIAGIWLVSRSEDDPTFKLDTNHHHSLGRGDLLDSGPPHQSR